MLSSDLLRMSYSKGIAKPLFIDKSYVDIIQEVISLISTSKTVGDAREEAKYLKKIYDPRLIDGIISIILRKARVEASYPVEPRIIRNKVFSMGPVTDEQKRREIIRSFYKELGFNPMKYIYSDMEDELEIKYVPKLNPIEIVKEYNTELLQTALLKGVRLKIYTSYNWKGLIYRMKRLGLMYNAYANPFYLEVFGPASLLRMTERYGRSMALLLPYIMKNKDWKIEAEIMGKTGKTYRLNVSNKDALFSENTEEYKTSFDSLLEESFYSKFKIIAKDWKILREPEPIVLKNTVFLPDFLVVKDGVKVYIEIVGFWTKEYIQRKAEKVKEFAEPLLLIVDESLGYGKIEGHNVIKFKKNINMAAVYIWLNNYYNSLKRRYSKVKERYGKEEKIRLSEDVVSFKDICNAYNIEAKTLKDKKFEIDGYEKLKNYFIKKDFLKKLSGLNFENKKLSELREEYGDYIIDVLEHLGYHIKWTSVMDAIVKKD